MGLTDALYRVGWPLCLDSLLVARGKCPNAESLQGSGMSHVITQLAQTWGVFFALQEGMQVT